MHAQYFSYHWIHSAHGYWKSCDDLCYSCDQRVEDCFGCTRSFMMLKSWIGIPISNSNAKYSTQTYVGCQDGGKRLLVHWNSHLRILGHSLSSMPTKRFLRKWDQKNNSFNTKHVIFTSFFVFVHWPYRLLLLTW